LAEKSDRVEQLEQSLQYAERSLEELTDQLELATDAKGALELELSSLQQARDVSLKHAHLPGVNRVRAVDLYLRPIAVLVAGGGAGDAVHRPRRTAGAERGA
jgi:DNA repair exonuclease SbcCD ATPase subunit